MLTKKKLTRFNVYIDDICTCTPIAKDNALENDYTLHIPVYACDK